MEVLGVSAVNKTKVIPDHRGIPRRMPERDFESEGFGSLIDWVAHKTQEIQNAKREVAAAAAKARRRKRFLIIGGVVAVLLLAVVYMWWTLSTPGPRTVRTVFDVYYYYQPGHQEAVHRQEHGTPADRHALGRREGRAGHRLWCRDCSDKNRFIGYLIAL